jgi:APA family basic amino acid/polyamine antiporter
VASGSSSGQASTRSSAPPRASAEFTYLEKAIPRVPSLAVMVGVLVAFSGIATSAAVSIAFGGYLEHFVAVPPMVSCCDSAIPDRERPFRVPLSVRGVPILPLIGVLLSIALMTQLEGRALVVGLGAGALVFALDFGIRSYRARRG